MLPAPGDGFRRYGGATLCIEVVNAAGSRLILDMGTGCIGLGNELLRRAAAGEIEPRAGIILSSTRIDHIHGLPFFVPALIPGWDIAIMGPSQTGRNISGILDGSLNPNYSPLYGVENLAPRLEMTTLTEGELAWDGFRIVTRELPHGINTALGFRIEADGGTLACIPDVEYPGEPSDTAIDLASDADVMIHDAMESAATVVKRRGPPSLCPPDALGALQLAGDAGVGRLILYHHDPDRTDANMDELVRSLRSGAPGIPVEAARTDQVVDVGQPRASGS